MAYDTYLQLTESAAQLNKVHLLLGVLSSSPMMMMGNQKFSGCADPYLCSRHIFMGFSPELNPTLEA